MIVLTPNPAHRFLGRDGSPSDEAVIRECWVENVYQIHRGDLRDTGILIDIGANIGAVSIYAASLGATVIAYEPEPDNLALLQQNIAGNGMAERVVVHAAAVTDWHGTAQLEPAHGNSRIVDYGSGITVPSITLDDVFADLPDGCDVLKIDIEGSERELIAAAAPETLARIRYLTMEFDAAPDDEFGAMVTKIAKVFNTHIIGSPERGGYIYGRRY
ncbi:FkbM family methyltransferase [Nocardia sp. CA-290969]|uniref:FkbM family methyltransferase n=1 Tax=Nocardia sp. CA-290969 TaxID=3239986 RepID=UPI003D94E420